MDELEKTRSSYKHGELTITMVTRGHNLSDVIEAFECALRGHGFYYNGKLEIVEDE
jgi:hypothetical protein